MCNMKIFPCFAPSTGWELDFPAQWGINAIITCLSFFTLVQIWLTQFPLEAADSILIVTGKCLIIILSLCCNMEKRIHITPLPHRLILFYFFGGGEYMNFELLGSGPDRKASWKVREIQLMDLGQITFCRIKVFWMHVRAPFNNVTIVSLVDFLSLVD